MLSKSLPQSDLIGAIASALCAIHCLATPFLFIAQTCTTKSSCCSGGPAWWSFIDYIFIVITLVAVMQSGKNTTKEWLKYSMYVTWAILSFLMINEKFGFFNIPVFFKYISAAALIVQHVYNLKYCQCDKGECCVNSTGLQKS